MTTGRLLVVLGAAALGACSNMKEPASTPDVVDDGGSMAVVGDTVPISLDITNTSADTVRVGLQDCNGDYVLVSESGSVFRPAQYWPCVFALTAPQPLAPGATRRIDGYTTGRVVPDGSQEAPSMVPPGKYAVRPTVTVQGGDDSAVTVRPTPASITFRSRP